MRLLHSTGTVNLLGHVKHTPTTFRIKYKKTTCIFLLITNHTQVNFTINIYNNMYL